MADDIYSKNIADDKDFRDDQPDIKDDLQIFLNQVRNLFSAEPGMVLGASQMGVGLEHLIYETNISPKNLEKVILEQVFTYCSFHTKFAINITVKFAKGTVRDIVFIDFLVDEIKREMDEFGYGWRQPSARWLVNPKFSLLVDFQSL